LAGTSNEAWFAASSWKCHEFGTSLVFFVVIGVVYAINLVHSLLENLSFEKYVHLEIVFAGWIRK